MQKRTTKETYLPQKTQASLHYLAQKLIAKGRKITGEEMMDKIMEKLMILEY